MDGIDAILQAEKEAERIRRDAHVEADALLGSAEGYRQRTLDAVWKARKKSSGFWTMRGSGRKNGKPSCGSSRT